MATGCDVAAGRALTTLRVIRDETTICGPRAASGVAAVLAVLASVFLAGLAAGCSGRSASPPAAAGPAALSARQILSRADAAARAAGSVHLSVITREGKTSIDVSDDAAAGDGRRHITMSDGGQLTGLLVSGVGYANGNATALSGFLGLTDAMSAQLAGRWASFSPGSPGYQQIVDGLTTSSVLDEIIPAGPLVTTGRQTVDGQQVIGVRGPAPASAQLPKGWKITLYVAASGRPLPVSCQEGPGSDQASIMLSHWGERVSVSAPGNAVPVPIQSTPPAAPGTA